MDDKVILYIIGAVTSNTIVESIPIYGYNIEDIYSYIILNYQQFSHSHPFIYSIIHNLITLYKTQYNKEPTILALQQLFSVSDQINNNNIIIIAHQSQHIINACSYQSNITNQKKTIQFKNNTIPKIKIQHKSINN